MRNFLILEDLRESIVKAEPLISCKCDHIRSGVLSMHQLTPAHFPDMDKALAAADKLISFHRRMIVGVAELHPGIIVGDPMLDQFWYAKHQGMKGIVLCVCVCVGGRGDGDVYI